MRHISTRWRAAPSPISAKHVSTRYFWQWQFWPGGGGDVDRISALPVPLSLQQNRRRQQAGGFCPVPGRLKERDELLVKLRCFDRAARRIQQRFFAYVASKQQYEASTMIQKVVRGRRGRQRRRKQRARLKRKSSATQLQCMVRGRLARWKKRGALRGSRSLLWHLLPVTSQKARVVSAVPVHAHIRRKCIVLHSKVNRRAIRCFFLPGKSHILRSGAWLVDPVFAYRRFAEWLAKREAFRQKIGASWDKRDMAAGKYNACSEQSAVECSLDRTTSQLAMRR